MDEATTANNPYEGLFKEDSEKVQRILKPEIEGEEQTFSAGPEQLPTVLSADPAEADQLAEFQLKLKTFFAGSGSDEGISADLMPAAFAPFIGKDRVQNAYPFYISEDRNCTLQSLLEEAATEHSENENYGLLQRTLPFVIDAVRSTFEAGKGAVEFDDAIYAGFQKFRDEINLQGEKRSAIMVMLGEIERALPKEGTLIPAGPSLPFNLLNGALATRTEAHEKLITKANELLSELRELYIKEQTIRNGKGQADESLGFADTLIDLSAVANVMPEAATKPMGDDRFKRIGSIIGELEKAEEFISNSAYITIQDSLAEGHDLKNTFPNTVCNAAPIGKLVETTEAEFNEHMERMTSLMVSIRKAELEVKDRYKAAVHDNVFAGMNWRQLSQDELAACPSSVLIADSDDLMHTELAACSEAIAHDLPITILALKNGDSAFNITDDLEVKQELAAFATAHRNAFVHQSVLVDPQIAFDGIEHGISSVSPSLIHLLLPSSSAKNQHIWSSAAIESRAFPTISYLGMERDRWGMRWDISNNPQANLEWPAHNQEIAGGDPLNLNFTFADFVAMNGSSSKEFMVVEPQFWSDDLIPLADYLAADAESRTNRIPFIWIVDQDLNLQKVAVSWKVAMASMERLDHWHYLQENGGVHNYHAEQALDALREELEKETEAKIEQLKAEHQTELEKVRAETTDKAMDQLTSMLLDMDPSTMVASSPAASPVTPPSAPAEEKIEEAAPEPVKEEEPETLAATEPWIETANCTTCDECTNLNGKIFQYNDDKLAFIADPKGGPFADIVAAAELCPVGIIHPGTPMDPKEPGLEELIAKAEPFN